MDTSLDNANNPFAISNGATTDNIISQKSDGLLLNLTDNFKQNGTDISPTADFYGKEKSNGKRSASEFDDDDFGPETDVDAVDNVLSPVETAKGFGDVFSNNNPAEGVYNPYMEHQEKAALEIERELQKQQSGEFEEQRLAREETPTPPADAVHDVSGLVDNAAESDSEDEWNYIKGDEANKENISPQPDKEVAEIPEEDDNMSQLNPNAAEFVPVSPTRSIPSPACRNLLNDEVISQSPRRAANEIDISLPNPVDFEKEVKSRPSEVESYSNGHGDGDSDINKTATDLMESLLNGKNIDEIPEFQPGSTPTKIVPSEEFHFGPNAAPFTPAKFLDQSEAALSTKAVYGDESTATLGTSFNESVASQDTAADLNLLNKESDPMSMSFYADKGDSNPFDLNEVHILPDNIDEFLQKPDTSTTFNDTISDLPEHLPLGEPKDTTEDVTLNNDDALQITDLDKQAYYDEKELASPLEPEKELSEPDRELLGEGEECHLSKTPEPTHEDLLDREFCRIPEKRETPDVSALPRDVELISPEPSGGRAESTSPRPESSQGDISESRSPLPEATEVSDLLQSQPESLPRDVELISPEPIISPRPESTHQEVSRSPLLEAVETTDLLHTESDFVQSKSPLPETFEVSDLLGEQHQLKSPLPEPTEVNDLLQTDSDIEAKSPLPEVNETADFLKAESDVSSKSPIPEIEHNLLETIDVQPAKSPLEELIDELEQSHTETFESKSPLPEVCELPQSKTPTSDIFESKSPVSERFDMESPLCELPTSKSPVCELPSSKSPVCELATEPPVSESPVCELAVEPPISKSPITELHTELPVSESPVCERVTSPICERPLSKSPVCELNVESKSPIPEPAEEVCSLRREVSSPISKDAVSPIPPEVEVDFVRPEEIAKAEQHFEEICRSEENLSKTQEDYTSPEVLQQAEDHFETFFRPKESLSGLESPLEDVTSSLKDDITSPAKSPVPDQIIEDSFTAEEPSQIPSIAQDIAGAIQESIVEAASEIPESCPIPSPKLIADTESVTTTVVSSFLEQSIPADVTSPLSPTEQEIDTTKAIVDPVINQVKEEPSEHPVPDILDLSDPLNQRICPLPMEVGEQIDIKTENITPEFAEQAIVTPSEESKQEDVPTAPLVEEPVKEPVVEEKQIEEQNESAPVVAAVGAAAAAAAGAAAVAAVAASPVKSEKEEKKKLSTSPTKKLAPAKTAPTKPTTKASTAPKVASRLNTSPKSAPARTSAAKPSTTLSAPKPAPSRVSPRAKPATAAPKPTERKPLVNGDIKFSVRSTLTAKKAISEATTTTTSTTTKSTTPRPATAGATKLSPTKSATSKPAATRPTTAPASRTTATTRTGTTPTSSAPKPRPTTLASRTTTSSATKPATLTKSPPAKTSPTKTTTAAPKPKPPTTTVIKQRVPLTKTVSKSTADAEKQIKESANKLTASRTVTSTTRTTASARTTTSTTVRKVESKAGARTTKTTTTTTKSTTAKKPAELVRHATSKTKTTKVEKPKENGITTVVTEEITVVNSTNAVVVDSEPQLIKDNSPVDNKLIIENTLIQTNTAD